MAISRTVQGALYPRDPRLLPTGGASHGVRSSPASSSFWSVVGLTLGAVLGALAGELGSRSEEDYRYS